MRKLLEVMRFEARYQLRSPFFLGALLMFALIHFMAITQTFIHIDNFSNQAAINCAYAILQIEQALFIFGILPIVAFVATAITRDFELSTASLLFVKPISPRTFALGKFLGALIPALLIGLAGLLGAMIGAFMPWLDQARIAPFSLLPWAYVFLVVILPNTVALCAIFFSVAAGARSFALTFAAAMAFFVAEALLNIYAKIENGACAVPLQATKPQRRHSATNEAPRNSKDCAGKELLSAIFLRAVGLATEDGSVLRMQKPAHLHHSGARGHGVGRRISWRRQPCRA
jgi:ABC-type transport system involved in multi-copper enzyme maturation permease subunit